MGQYVSELAGREYLLFRSKFKEADEPDAEASAHEPMLLRIARTPNLACALLKVASNKGANRLVEILRSSQSPTSSEPIGEADS